MQISSFLTRTKCLLLLNYKYSKCTVRYIYRLVKLNSYCIQPDPQNNKSLRDVVSREYKNRGTTQPRFLRVEWRQSLEYWWVIYIKLLCHCCYFLYCTMWAIELFGLHHMSKDAEKYGEEDQTLRWTRCWKNLEKTPRPKLAFACRLGRAHTKREDDLTLKQKGGQTTLARSYTKVAAMRGHSVLLRNSNL